MDVSDLGGNILKVALHGRLDTAGVDQIETRFSATLVPGAHNAVVDLSDVSFVASMGVRMFISVARALSQKGCRMVLLSPQVGVNDMFGAAAIPKIIPVVFDEREAVGLMP
ncbi:STAS domain-containing protein [Iodidimonas sp. SYSU 1G8]|uniref:STAS domain-containing protein n=1 Tax=Iodidimonas sp. SYSU 1G8 TaxID=3133967 RepID=UPI0031FEB388